MPEVKLMTHQEWQLTRRRLLEDEQRERQSDLSASRAPIQAAVTERAVREMWVKIEALAAKVEALEKRK
jgi:hypothetical protein